MGKGVKSAYFYTNNHNKALQHTNRGHRWTNGRDADGHTICATPKQTNGVSFKFRGYEMYRVPVRGFMKSPQIYRACQAKGMKPLCDHANYNDGKCKAVGGHRHWSHPHHVRRHARVDQNRVKWAFFYCGRANHKRSLLNTGRSHRWSHDNRDRDGETFCVKRDKDFFKKHGKFKHHQYKLERVSVSGRISSHSIWKACQKKGMRPVCDHANYFDGRCVVVNGRRHMSRQDNRKGVRGAYFYCGRANHNRALQHRHRGHHWSNNNDHDGDTLCAKPLPRRGFKHYGYEMVRVKVSGYMKSPQIRAACGKRNMKPLCDHANYNDGHCVSIGGHYHWSHPHHVRHYIRADQNQLKWAFFYCGRANHRRSLLNTGRSHRWSRDNRDRDGDTFCVKRDHAWLKKHGKFNLRGYSLKRVTVKGRINSDSIYHACTKHGLRPVCDHASYFDGRCEVVRGYSHMSRDGHHGVRGVYFYCGRANHNRALQHVGRGHRWTNGRDTHGDTLCTKRKALNSFKYRGQTLHRARVSGRMDSHHIRRACKAKGMIPVCDHASYNDGKCKVLGGRWHWSHRHHVRHRARINNDKVKWAFFYCGRANHQRSLLNNRRSHRWSHHNRDRDGDTFCVKAGSTHGKTGGQWYLRGGRQNKYCWDNGHHGLRCTSNGMQRGRDGLFKIENKRCGHRQCIAIRGGRRNLYCADERNRGRIICNRGHAHQWEKFQLRGSIGNNHQISIKGGQRRWRYFCADENHRNRGRVICNRGHAHQWERFRLVKAGSKFSYGGFTMSKVAVNGRVNTNTIYATCRARGLVPVCG